MKMLHICHLIPPRIEFLYKYLTYIENILNQEIQQDNHEIQRLIDGVVELKDNLNNSTKAEVISKYSKLAAKAKNI